MNLYVYILIGFAASKIARRFMKNRYYSRIDDFLLGVLGALLGSACAEEFGLSAYGNVVLPVMAVAGAGFMLLLSGMVAHDTSAREICWEDSFTKRTITQSNIVDEPTTNMQVTPQVSHAA